MKKNFPPKGDLDGLPKVCIGSGSLELIPVKSATCIVGTENGSKTLSAKGEMSLGRTSMVAKISPCTRSEKETLIFFSMDVVSEETMHSLWNGRSEELLLISVMRCKIAMRYSGAGGLQPLN